jgi:hypothetical protein
MLARLMSVRGRFATPAAGRPGERLVLSPRPGQVVRSNVALLRIHSG